MDIYAVLLVKDEADIIRPVLDAAAEWATGIFVLDNGSTDGTWEIVQSMESEVVHPWKQDQTPYRRSLRAEIFNQFRHVASRGDWWCNMDADEFYVDDPREFLAQVPRRFHVVMKKSIDYRLTHEDVAEYSFTGDFSADRTKLQYLEPHSWIETRFFRHRPRLRWDSSGPTASDLPAHLGVHYPRPILAKHYQYRSPHQIQRRLDVRNAVPRDPEKGPFKHIRQTAWQETLVARSQTVKDAGRSTWLALPNRSRVADKLPRRMVKHLMHGLGLWA